jgi:hypothetical protein
MTTITRREACDLITKSIGQTPTTKEFDLIAHAVNSDLQVRDFLMGLPIEHDMQKVIDFICHMVNFTIKEQEAPFVSIALAFAFETNSTDTCKSMVKYLEEEHAKYPLAALLIKVVNSNWPTTTLKNMRDELHPKVKEACYGKSGDTVVGSKE